MLIRILIETLPNFGSRISRERSGWEVGRMRREAEEEEELVKLLQSDHDDGLTDDDDGEQTTSSSDSESSCDDEIANAMETTVGNLR